MNRPSTERDFHGKSVITCLPPLVTRRKLILKNTISHQIGGKKRKKRSQTIAEHRPACEELGPRAHSQTRGESCPEGTLRHGEAPPLGPTLLLTGKGGESRSCSISLGEHATLLPLRRSGCFPLPAGAVLESVCLSRFLSAVARKSLWRAWRTSRPRDCSPPLPGGSRGGGSDCHRKFRADVVGSCHLSRWGTCSANLVSQLNSSTG